VTAALWVEAEAALVAQVQREENPNLLKGQLAALCLLLSGEKAQEARLRGLEGLRVFVTRLAGEEEEEEDDGGEIAARALELLGHLLPAPSTEGDGATTTRLWLRRVERAARPEGHPSLRMAALRSIAASGLLLHQGCNSSGGGAVVVGALLTTLRVAHDDDDAVREAACALLAASLVDGSGAWCCVGRMRVV
jgi:hypothetical protein